MAMNIERKEFWTQHFEKLKASGLSRSQYSRENGVNYDMFGYWIKRLSTASSDFVPVKLQASESTPSYATLCTVEFRGHTLKIHDLSALSFVLERLT